MKIDTTKRDIIVTLYSDDIGRLVSKDGVIYTGLFIGGREISINYVACLQCQEKMMNEIKKHRVE